MGSPGSRGTGEMSHRSLPESHCVQTRLSRGNSLPIPIPKGCVHLWMPQLQKDPSQDGEPVGHSVLLHPLGAHHPLGRWDRCGIPGHPCPIQGKGLQDGGACALTTLSLSPVSLRDVCARLNQICAESQRFLGNIKESEEQKATRQGQAGGQPVPAEPNWPPEPRGHCGKHRAFLMVQLIRGIIQDRAWRICSSGSLVLAVPTTGSWEQSRTLLGTHRSWHQAGTMGRGRLQPCVPKNWGSSMGMREPSLGMGLEWDCPTQIPSLVLVGTMAMPGLGLISLAQRERGEELFPFPAAAAFPSSAMQLARLGCCV